jgi:hypothetical protein
MKKTAIVLGLVMAFCCSGAAMAQDDDMGKFGVYAGVYSPMDSDASDAVGSTWWTLGGYYDAARTDTAAHRVGLGWIQTPARPDPWWRAARLWTWSRPHAR